MFKDGFSGLRGFIMNIRNELLFVILDIFAGLLAFALDPFKLRIKYPEQNEIIFFIVYLILAIVSTFLLVFIFHSLKSLWNRRNKDDFSLLSKGIKVTHKERNDGVNLIITNDTEYNLGNAYLAVKDTEPELEPARREDGTINWLKLLFGASTPDPLSGTEFFWIVDRDYQHRTNIESHRSATSHAIKVESTGQAGFLVDKYSERRLLSQSSQRQTRAIMYFDIGEMTAKIQFGGTKPSGEVLTKVFKLELVYDGKEVKVKRIRE